MARLAISFILTLAVAACGRSATRPTASAASTSPPSPPVETSPMAPSLSSGTPPGSSGACPPAPSVADLHVEASTIVGFGAAAETLFLDGNRATLLVRETGDLGQVVGTFETCAREETVKSLEGIITLVAVAKEPRTRDGAAVAVTWRSGARTLSAATDVPPASPPGVALVKVFTDLSTAARGNPKAAVRLDLVAPKDAAAGKPARYVVRVVNVGTAPVSVAFPDGGPWLEATALPLDNPMWEPLGDKLGSVPRTPIAPGAALDLAITLTHKAKKNVAVLARFAGSLELVGAAHVDAPFATRLASPLVEVGVR